jgi:hypothetical protein
MRTSILLILLGCAQTMAGVSEGPALSKKTAQFKVISTSPFAIECQDSNSQNTGKSWKAPNCILELSTSDDPHVYRVTVGTNRCDLSSGDEVSATLTGNSCLAFFPFECTKQGKPKNMPDLHQMSCDNRTSWFISKDTDLKVLKRAYRKPN